MPRKMLPKLKLLAKKQNSIIIDENDFVKNQFLFFIF
jgi:hypothetical protein